ncbi:putative MFS family arabinose efflux permease [Krasilnikovia cinnamomea]|uniref:Putative MFS family arabinose efflux permease n=1 Tax=Krasilnikovia cinnamomea TaxID=349313 RepID=A0A4Q7ZR69_9ACTN|nr:MFS transporter [Krasilnikovia cinnamomea]RZU53304.1 putative MFS family arabinose efflux permease [Krasilnikovia cinnamomea]
MSTLWRNREFNLLWTSQSLSDLGTGVASLALSLLVLVETGSAVGAGLVGTLSMVARLVIRLPGGVLVDRYDRRRVMVICDSLRLAAFTTLTLAVFSGQVSLPMILLVTLIDSSAGAVFGAAEDAALRSIVPVEQLPAAVARNEARSYGTSLAGPPLGGFLFGLGHAVPFLSNAISYLVSAVAVLRIHKPLQGEREEHPQAYGAALAEGVRFVFGNPFLRALLLIAVPLNFAITGVLFTVVVALQQNGTPPAVIGLAETIVAVGGLLGAVVAPALQNRFSLPCLVRGICWAAAVLLAGSALLISNVGAAVPLGLAVFLGPACTAALFGYQAAVTPDRLQGRVISIVMVVATSMAALAPTVGGIILSSWSPSIAVLVFAAAVVVSALTATFGGGLQPAVEPEPAEAALK